MKRSDYIVKSLINASAVFIYVYIVAWLLFNGKEIFGEDPPGFILPLFLLLLFVISASITGLLVLGKPIHLYLSGSKKEAFTLLAATLAWLIIFAVMIIIVLLLS